VLMSSPHTNPDVRECLSCYLGALSVTRDLGCSLSGVTAFVGGTHLIIVRVYSLYIPKISL